MSKVIGTVKDLSGTVKVTNSEGGIKFLVVGDQILAGDTIESMGSGSAVISYLDGTQESILAGNSLSIPLEEPIEVAQNETTVEDIEALLQSEDEEDAPAAGEEGGAEGGVGAGFYHDRLEFGKESFELSGVEFSRDRVAIEGGGGEEPHNAVVTLSATPQITEDDNFIIYTASLDNQARSAMTIELSNGAVITIPAGGRGGSVRVPVSPDSDVYVEADEIIDVSIASTTGGGYDNVDSIDDASTVIVDTTDTTTVSITTADVNEDATSVTFNISLDNLPQGATTATVKVTNQDNVVTTHTVTIDPATGLGALTIATQDSDVYIDAQSLSAKVTSINGGNFENVDTGLAVTANVTDTTDTTTVILKDVTVNEGTATATIAATLDHVPTDGDLVFTLSNGSTVTFTTGYNPGNEVQSTPFSIQGDDVYVDKEIYTVSVISYAGGAEFENVVHTDTSKVTINDTVDTVFIKLIDNDTAAEGNNLTHKVQLVDANGDALVVANGETITVTIGYAPSGSDGAESEDYDATTTVTIVGGASEQLFTVNASTDFFNEADEEYTATITNIAQTATNIEYEDIKPSLKVNGANEDATNVTGTIADVDLNINVDDAYVDEDNFTPQNLNTLVGGKHDANGTPLDNNDDTITSAPTLLNLPETDLVDSEYEFEFVNSVVLNTDTIATGGADTLTSNGNAITTAVNGNIITGTDANGVKVFDIVINKNSNTTETDDSYVYTQYQNIDHPTANADDTLTMEFGFKIKATNGGDESAVQNFTVTVNDSLPNAIDAVYDVDEDSSVKITLIEEGLGLTGSLTIDSGNGTYQELTSSNAIGILDPNDLNMTIGQLNYNDNGYVTFTPNDDYSNYNAQPSFKYNITDSDGDEAVGEISFDVKPVADGLDWSYTRVATDEDVNIDMNLTLPEIRDNSDDNAGATGDHAERIGAISLTSIDKGAIVYNGGTALNDGSSTTTLKFVIVDGSGAIDTDLHHSDLVLTEASTIYLTQAEYEALTINSKP